MLWRNKHLLLTGHIHLESLATIRYTLEYILPLALFDATICNIKVYSVFPEKEGEGAAIDFGADVYITLNFFVGKGEGLSPSNITTVICEDKFVTTICQ
jgi:hypothetical protein